MADKIQIGLDDQTDAGAASAEQNLQEIRDEAKALEQQLERVSTASDEAARDVGKMGDRGKDVQKLNLRLTEINQGLELLKKGAELVSRAVTTLAEEGNPAFVSLQRSIGDVRSALIEIAEDPEIQSFITKLSDQIATEFIPNLKEAGQAAGPVLSGISDGFRSAQRWISNSTLAAGEFIGVFDEAATSELRLTKELDDARRAAARAQAEQNRKLRETAEAQKQIGDIHSKVAQDEELRSIAAIEDERQLNDLLQQEREGLIELARTGEEGGRKREDYLRRIELIERRLVEIPRKRAEEEKRAAAEAQKERDAEMQAALEAEEELQRQRVELAVKAERERTKIMAEEAEKRVMLAKREFDERVKIIQGADGGKLLDQARQAIDPRAVRQQIAQQRGQQAAEQFTRERAGDLDASDAAAVRRFRAQREVARQQAERAAAQQFNRGQVSSDEIGQAQNALIRASAQQAASTGQLSQENARAMIEVVNTQQRLAEEQSRQAQEMQQIRRAAAQAGQTVQSTRQRAISGGFRR